jgi:hypothetical protein
MIGYIRSLLGQAISRRVSDEHLLNCLGNFCQESQRIGFQCPGNHKQFDHIDPPPTSLSSRCGSRPRITELSEPAWLLRRRTSRSKHWQRSLGSLRASSRNLSCKMARCSCQTGRDGRVICTRPVARISTASRGGDSTGRADYQPSRRIGCRRDGMPSSSSRTVISSGWRLLPTPRATRA